MIRFTCKTALTLLAATSALACQPEDEGASPADEYRNSLPTEQTMAVKLPGQAVGAAAGDSSVQKSQQALLGETAEFYKLTRAVSRSVNGGVIVVLNLVRAVVHHPPTRVTENTAVWGPFTEALSPVTWKVTVTKLGATEYRYEFQGKPKAADDTAFLTVLSGIHHPTLGPDGRPIEGFGEGNFVLDFDKSRMLEPGEDVGLAKVSYSRRTLGVTAHISAGFEKVRDDERPGRRVDVDYLYVENPNGSGELDFTFEIDPAVVKPNEPGKMAVKSRWLPTGAGRADVQGTGGNLAAGTSATASECWNDAFASTHLGVSWAPAAGWGESASCVFDSAVYSTLTLD